MFLDAFNLLLWKLNVFAIIKMIAYNNIKGGLAPFIVLLLTERLLEFQVPLAGRQHGEAYHI